ncbi:MAG: Bax inhibitor-1/YccA family protein [Pseudomonadota bacterium]
MDKYFDLTKSPSSSQEEGLRAYMLKIYNYMSAGLVLTGLMAWFSAHSPTFLNAMYQTEGSQIVGMKPLAWVIMIAPVALAMLLSFGINRMSLRTAQASFWGYAAIMGLSLSSIFLTYTSTSIATVFFITAATFGGMSVYGYITKRDLTAFRSFLMMGLFGVIIASVVNIFLQSPALLFTLSVMGVLVFTGLTAYDTQKLKNIYLQASVDRNWIEKITIIGALNLYLDFINLFMSLLNLTDRRR